MSVYQIPQVTHCGREKMAAFFANEILKSIFLIENV